MVLCTLFLLGIFGTFNTSLTNVLYGDGEVLEDIVIIGIDDASLQAIGRFPWERGNYSLLIEQLSLARAIGIDVGFYEPSPHDEALVSSAQTHPVVLAAQYTDFTQTRQGLIGNEVLVPFAGANVTYGYVNMHVESDGVVRALHPVQGEMQSFTQEIFSTLYKERVVLDAPFRIRFAGPPNTFPIYSFSDVLLGNIPQETFAKKIVLVGATAPDLRDIFLVPTSQGQMMSGVEIHANSLQTLILNNPFTTTSTTTTLLSIFFACILIGVLFRHTSVLVCGISVLVLVGAYLFLAVFLAAHKNLLVNVVYIPLACILTYVVLVAVSYLLERKKKQDIHSAFGKYLSPHVIEELIANPDKLKLGGEKRKVMIYFSDIVGFTTLCEKLGPHKIVELLNEYLTEMTKIILDADGAVDKFIGDAVMAYWGAPLAEKNPVHKGCEATLAMLQRLDELRPVWKKKYGVEVNIRVGLHYGDAILGNLGSQQRFDYTLIGDSVNLAARLESINKQYGTRVCVSQSVVDACKNAFMFRSLDHVTVKGKTTPTKIFELLPKDISQKELQDMLVFEEGFGLYLKGKFTQAQKIFSTLKKDTPAGLFVSRCMELKKQRLKKWDGVFVMESK